MSGHKTLINLRVEDEAALRSAIWTLARAERP
jgi:hypothetical protein